MTNIWSEMTDSFTITDVIVELQDSISRGAIHGTIDEPIWQLMELFLSCYNGKRQKTHVLGAQYLARILVKSSAYAPLYGPISLERALDRATCCIKDTQHINHWLRHGFLHLLRAHVSDVLQASISTPTLARFLLFDLTMYHRYIQSKEQRLLCIRDRMIILHQMIWSSITLEYAERTLQRISIILTIQLIQYYVQTLEHVTRFTEYNGFNSNFYNPLTSEEHNEACFNSHIGQDQVSFSANSSCTLSSIMDTNFHGIINLKQFLKSLGWMVYVSFSISEQIAFSVVSALISHAQHNQCMLYVLYSLLHHTQNMFSDTKFTILCTRLQKIFTSQQKTNYNRQLNSQHDLFKYKVHHTRHNAKESVLSEDMHQFCTRNESEDVSKLKCKAVFVRNEAHTLKCDVSSGFYMFCHVVHANTLFNASALSPPQLPTNIKPRYWKESMNSSSSGTYNTPTLEDWVQNQTSTVHDNSSHPINFSKRESTVHQSYAALVTRWRRIRTLCPYCNGHTLTTAVPIEKCIQTRSCTHTYDDTYGNKQRYESDLNEFTQTTRYDFIIHQPGTSLTTQHYRRSTHNNIHELCDDIWDTIASFSTVQDISQVRRADKTLARIISGITRWRQWFWERFRSSVVCICEPTTKVLGLDTVSYPIKHNWFVLGARRFAAEKEVENCQSNKLSEVYTFSGRKRRVRSAKRIVCPICTCANLCDSAAALQRHLLDHHGISKRRVANLLQTQQKWNLEKVCYTNHFVMTKNVTSVRNNCTKTVGTKLKSSVRNKIKHTRRSEQSINKQTGKHQTEKQQTMECASCDYNCPTTNSNISSVLSKPVQLSLKRRRILQNIID